MTLYTIYFKVSFQEKWKAKFLNLRFCPKVKHWYMKTKNIDELNSSKQNNSKLPQKDVLLKLNNKTQILKNRESQLKTLHNEFEIVNDGFIKVESQNETYSKIFQMFKNDKFQKLKF